MHADLPDTPQAGDRIADRYLVEKLVGRGGYGAVFRCRDLLSDQIVALKWMERQRAADAARLRREVAALRLLRLPGVVRLVDEGEERGYRYLVMEFIDGEPFPGPRRRLSWTELAPAALSLLEALGRIHDAGVVHRDLKPANVLVKPDGGVIVLDFGLVTGEPVGQSITGQGALIGTPGYLAPELVMGYRADVRADLYACGVMFYEVLAGRRPVRADNALSLIRAAVFDEPEPLLSLESSVPPEVARCIDRMVSANPAQRPASAAEASRLLGLRQALAHDDVPWLGGDALTETIAATLLAGRSVTLAGGEGMGKTAVLQRVAAHLARVGQQPLLLHHGKAPLSSLGELAPNTAELAGLDLPAAMALAEQRTAAAVRAGRILLIDDADRGDRWSAQVVERVVERGGGACLRTVRVAAGDALVLEPLGEASLMPLFAGPERLLHLPSTAARVLRERTGGVPAQVRREVALWLRAGTARWHASQLVVKTEQLSRIKSQALPLSPVPRDMGLPALGDTAPLGPTPRTSDVGLDGARDWLVGSQQAELLTWTHLAWPHSYLRNLADWLEQPLWRLEATAEELVDRGALVLHADGRLEPRWPPPGLGMWTADELSVAHRRIAQSLPVGAERRLFHLVAGDCIDEVAGEVLVLARRDWHDGRLIDAQGAVSEALLIVRREGHHDAENRLLVLLGKLALVELEPGGLERAIYEVGRAKQPSPLLTVCDRLLRLAIEVARNRSELLLPALRAPLAGGDEELELARCSLALLVSRSSSLQAEREVAQAVVEWAQAQPSQLLQATADHWLGRLRYGEADYRAAADLQTRPIRLGEPRAQAAHATLVRADSLLELRQFDEVIALCAEVAAFARPRNLVAMEAHAEWLVRACHYRRGECLPPDLELAQAAAVAGISHWEAIVCLTEAAFAWRAGQLDVASQLMRQSRDCAERFGVRWAVVLAALLDALMHGQLASADQQLAEKAVGSCQDARLAIEVYGILAATAPQPRPEWAQLARQLAQGLTAEELHGRLDIWSPAEALRAIDLAGL